MKPADWTEADRYVRLEDLGHEHVRVYDGVGGEAVAWTCLDCKPNRGPFETLRECQDACLEREIEARCGEDGTI